ncbi:hypothetical protein [Streptomyces chartreusis]|uniref:hypothetical protein n=1 Tax=Streptomyces chartreusis TaxID=1969 RepID=UPI0033A4CDF7
MKISEASRISGVSAPGSPQVHPLADAPAVVQELEAGRTRGKHALDPWLQV